MVIPLTTVESRVHKNDWIERPTAFIVLGLEGAGTYMMHNALVESGCINFDVEYKPKGVESLGVDVAIRRSFPHAGKWPMWKWLDYRCREAGYATVLIWIIREPNAQVQSVLRRDPARNIIDLLENQKSFFKDMSEIAHYSRKEPAWVVVTYSAFIHSEGFRRWLFEERLGLPYPEDFEVRDENIKYYNEQIE